MRIIKSEINTIRNAPTDDIIHGVIQNELDLMQATYDAISSETLLETALIIKMPAKYLLSALVSMNR